MIKRKRILDALNKQIEQGKHIIGVSCGNGLAAKTAVRGGADLIFALNSGRFRATGHGTLAGFLPFVNCNEMVMDFGTKELLPLINDIPVIFGLCATDPTIEFNDYFDVIKEVGFSGINNYPTIGMIGQQFREALEEEGISYDAEIEAIRVAHVKDMFTVAFTFDAEQAERMVDAGADIVCAHLGMTEGGLLGAKKVLSLEAGVKLAKEIFEVCDKKRPGVIKTIYGGPVNTALDLKYFYDNTSAQGYIGGSAFERIPAEEAIISATNSLKVAGDSSSDKMFAKILSGITQHYNYVTFVKEYVAKNYMQDISFSDIAQTIHVSRSYLSTLFKNKVGCTFPEYLANYRINKAVQIMRDTPNAYLNNVAEMVGYYDYAHFSKAFKKKMGKSPREYLKTIKE